MKHLLTRRNHEGYKNPAKSCGAGQGQLLAMHPLFQPIITLSYPSPRCDARPVHKTAIRTQRGTDTNARKAVRVAPTAFTIACCEMPHNGTNHLLPIPKCTRRKCLKEKTCSRRQRLCCNTTNSANRSEIYLPSLRRPMLHMIRTLWRMTAY